MLTLEKSTASHRPALMLPTLLLSQDIDNFASVVRGDDAGEPTPSEATKNAAKSLIAGIPLSLLGRPEISPFYGEIHVHWMRGTKQIILMCFPDRPPLVHHYLRVPSAPSEHGIEVASEDSVLHWLRWLNS